MHNPRHPPSASLTIVIKLGTSSIVNEQTFQPQLALLSALTELVCSLKKLGHRVVLVSSGAIGMGLKRMELDKKPKLLAEKQALAAIGQGRLIALWDNLFSLLGQPIAQVLLTRNDISDRSRYLNSTKTLSALLNYGVIPIVNENDTVSVQEIKFGDNDTLSAITASMVQADYLFLLTDVDCLYTENPRRFPDTAKPVQIVRDIEEVRKLVSTATLGSSLGTGGMETKLIAAELATGAGVATVITHGMKPSSILAIVSQQLSSSEEDGAAAKEEEAAYVKNTPLHTLFLPKQSPLSDRRWWVLHGLKPRGRIIIDEGAYRAIARSAASSSNLPTPTASQVLPPRSASSASFGNGEAPVASTSSSSGNGGNGGRLLAAGVIAVEGTFAAGQAVTVVVQRKRRSRATASSSTGRDQSLEYTPEQSRAPSPRRRRSRKGTTSDDSDWDEDNLQEDVIEQIEFGRGLANYNYQEIDKIKGHKSSEIEKLLGYIEAEHCVESITSLKRLEL